MDIKTHTILFHTVHNDLLAECCQTLRVILLCLLIWQKKQWFPKKAQHTYPKRGRVNESLNHTHLYHTKSVGQTQNGKKRVVLQKASIQFPGIREETRLQEKQEALSDAAGRENHWETIHVSKVWENTPLFLLGRERNLGGITKPCQHKEGWGMGEPSEETFHSFPLIQILFDTNSKRLFDLGRASRVRNKW